MSNNVLKTSESFNNRQQQRLFDLCERAFTLASKYVEQGPLWKHWMRMGGRFLAKAVNS